MAWLFASNLRRMRFEAVARTAATLAGTGTVAGRELWFRVVEILIMIAGFTAGEEIPRPA
jgi:hypothetical protein